MITTTEILKILRIKAGKTLTRWHQRGLIPPPTVGTHPNGRGKMAYWPDWVLGRCQEIKRLLRDGTGLDNILAELGPPIEPTHARRYDPSRIAAAEEKFERKCRLSELAYDQFSKVARRNRKRPQQFFSRVGHIVNSSAFVRRVVEMARNGDQPTLVVFADRVELVRAREVHSLIAVDVPQTVIILPLEQIASSVYGDARSLESEHDRGSAASIRNNRRAEWH